MNASKHTGRAVATMAALGLATLVGGCRGGEPPAPIPAPPTVPVSAPATSTNPSTSTVPTTRPAGSPGTTATTAPATTPVPSGPPVAASAPRPCDGRSVLCVDGSARASSPDGSKDRPFGSVAAAVSAAGQGSVIQVAGGTYRESLVLNEQSDVSIVGGFTKSFGERDASRNETILQGDERAAVVMITASKGIRVEGFRITGGGGTSNEGGSPHGGGVDIDETSTDVTIVGNHIIGNDTNRGSDPTGARGGGIASNAARLSVVGNVIEDNRSGRGSGVAANGVVTVEGNTVRNNVSVGDHGGGLYLAGTPTVTGNLVIGNSVGTDYSWGGGIIVFNDGTKATLQNNIVTGNKAISAGSGVFVDDGADATLRNELYYNNQCSENGGEGLYVDSGGDTPTVVDAENLTIADNECPGENGAHGVFVDRSEADDPSPQVTVTNSIFWHNGGRDVSAVGDAVRTTFTLADVRLDGEGNKTGDPKFVNPSSGDFRLRAGSAAIDAGNPASPYDNEPQPNGGRIDLGHTGNTQARSES